MTEPGWFDWLSLSIGIVAAAVPAAIALALWQNERRERKRDLRAAAGLAFTAKLERLDEVGLVFARAKYLSEYAVVMGAGARPLIQMIDTTLEWTYDGTFDKEIDAAVDISELIRQWTYSPDHRANLIEIYLSNGNVALADEDNLLISPISRQRAEREILAIPEYSEWLHRTRLSRTLIRSRRMWSWFRIWKKSLPKVLNPFATRDWLMDGEEAIGDSWLLSQLHEV